MNLATMQDVSNFNVFDKYFVEYNKKKSELIDAMSVIFDSNKINLLWLYLEKISYGYLTLARYQQPLPQDLWLLATGTGLAPFLSMLQDFETWNKYQKINLVYSVRTASELAYVDRIQEIAKLFGEGHSGFRFIPIITRDPDAALHDRLPVLIANGELEKVAGSALSPASSHVMLCGNPQMVEDTKEALKQRGLTMNRRGEGNIAVENYW